MKKKGKRLMLRLKWKGQREENRYESDVRGCERKWDAVKKESTDIRRN